MCENIFFFVRTEKLHNNLVSTTFPYKCAICSIFTKLVIFARLKKYIVDYAQSI